MKYEILALLFIALLCVIGFLKNYKVTRQSTNFFYKYSDLIFALQWILIAIMNAADSLLFLPLMIIFIIIQVKVSKAIRISNLKK
jgi:hypothetical protein